MQQTPSAEVRASARIGRLVGGRYRIRDLIGLGAMGSAWSAWDTKLDQPVVLKIHEEGFGGPRPKRALERFLREAETLASVTHENVRQLLASGTDPDTHEAFLVLEPLQGMTLTKTCAGQPRDVRWALDVARRVAHGLEAVHQAGVLHRDIKPQNVILHRGRRGVVPKIIDFGLARPIHPKAPVTGSRLAVGTPGYMAPEQARGQSDLDGRIDVYGLGVTLYEMLTASLPFEGATAMDLMIATVTDTALTPRHHRPQLPEAVERLVLKALAKAREDRFASAGAMCEAITAIMP